MVQVDKESACLSQSFSSLFLFVALRDFFALLLCRACTHSFVLQRVVPTPFFLSPPLFFFLFSTPKPPQDRSPFRPFFFLPHIWVSNRSSGDAFPQPPHRGVRPFRLPGLMGILNGECKCVRHGDPRCFLGSLLGLAHTPQGRRHSGFTRSISFSFLFSYID